MATAGPRRIVVDDLKEVGGPTAGERYRPIHDADLGGGTDGVLEAGNFVMPSPFATWKVTLTNVSLEHASRKVAQVVQGMKLYMDLFIYSDTPIS